MMEGGISMEHDMSTPWDRRIKILDEQAAARLATRDAAEQSASGLPAPTAPAPASAAPNCPVAPESLTGRIWRVAWNIGETSGHSECMSAEAALSARAKGNLIYGADTHWLETKLEMVGWL